MDGLESLDSGPARRVRDKIDWLAENAGLIHHETMTGRFQGMYKLRAGAYRALYYLDQENRTIIFDVIGHRSSVYY